MSRKPTASQQPALTHPQETAAVWRRAEAKRRLEEALGHIQAAQDELGRACAMLSSLRYGSPAWKRVSRLYDQVHGGWYRVAALRHHAHLEMDRDPDAKELAAMTEARS